ncbi:MAG: chemotaxis protein CheW [Myxococcales bacterium]|jgi:purine-binding chemotaxis protein CheW
MVTSRQRHELSKSLVGFVVGDVHYAVHIARVREIAKPLVAVALPHAPHAVAGVADYRGEVVPVVDMRERFGLLSVPASRRTKWIVVDVGDQLVALVVDYVTEVFGTAEIDLRPPPPMGGHDARGITGVTTHRGVMVFVLDVVRLREVTEPLLALAALGVGVSMAPKALL